MTHLWLQVLPILVEDCPPTCFVWNGQSYRVAQMMSVWRLDTAWWRGRIWRDNYRLLTDNGLLVDVYQDLDSQAWFLQRVWD